MLLNFISQLNTYRLLENEPWRFGAVLLTILISMMIGKLAQYFLHSYAMRRRERCAGDGSISIFLEALSKAAMLFMTGIGLLVCYSFLRFETPENPIGMSAEVGDYWIRISQAIIAASFAYMLFRLVDLVEHHLLKLASRTSNQLDNMLVPVIKKTLRITIIIISALWIADGILQWNISTILATAGLGGLAVAFAAKETIANFFGSITIFADRPFHVGELVRVGGQLGTVQDVGFRSTRLRTLEGAWVTIPNSIVANEVVENVGARPYIRRISNITITYDSGPEKAEKAVEIIKDILASHSELNGNLDTPPRVMFNDFNDWSLNVYMTYYYRPGDDWWGYQALNEKVNLEMMHRFRDAGIEYAFPSQTVYLDKGDADNS